MHMYVYPQRQSDMHPHEHTETYINAGSTMKIVSELIIFILSSRSHFWIGVLMQSFFLFFFLFLYKIKKKNTYFGPYRPVSGRIKNREKKILVTNACVAASTVARYVRASWTRVHRSWRHTCAFHELIRQDNENKLLFWIICNILSHLRLINLNLYVIGTC